MAKRFSREQLLSDLGKMIADRGEKFDPRNGWAQVEGKGEKANRDYAEWSTLNMVYSLIKGNAIGR